MHHLRNISLVSIIMLLMLATLLAACGGGQTTVVVESTPAAQTDTESTDTESTNTEDTDTEDTDTTEDTEDTDTEPTEDTEDTNTEDTNTEDTDTESTGATQEPHPILSDKNVRQAIAYCTDRAQLVEAVYPFLDAAQRENLLMDTFIPNGHWAHSSEGIVTYPFDPEKGIALLEESGWVANANGSGPRVNADGDPLSLEFTTTDAAFRVTWATVLEQQLLDNCGIEIVRTHAPGSWWFGGDTGLQRRDFELGAYAWVGQADPSGNTLYACNQIPLPENNWEGQNYMGWCNETAHKAIIAANSFLDREDRQAQYAIVQQEFTKDMVSLPLFNRFEAAAASNNLINFAPDVSESSYVVNIDEWEMEDGGDTVIIGLTQEPSTLHRLIESSSVTQIAGDLLSVRAATGKGYDYQPVVLTQLPTLENGGATLEEVEVAAGDTVWNSDGEAVPLAPGVEVLNADNEFVTYESGTLTLHQLTVNFEIQEGLMWEDGVPVTAADLQLAQDINCDPDSGAVSLLVCNSIESFAVTSDTSFTYTYLPGAKWPEYMVYTAGTYAGTTFSLGAYPAHRELSDGRILADVPASEWSTLKEIAEQPLSYGPYRLVSWEKGQRMVFEPNPHYYKGEPKIKNVIIQFFSDTNAAVAQLLTGDVDVVGTESLGAGAELERVFRAGNEGKIQFFPLASSTWEHVDMNLYKK
jgi:ABC-type transport system substrate-binding protein